MRNLPFKKSSECSIGVELELQIIDCHSYSLVSRAKDLIRCIHESDFQKRITPEITQSMIEMNTSVHQRVQKMVVELNLLHAFLLEQATKLNVAICGGGTHPFYKWQQQKIFPSLRYKKIAKKYRHLSKQATLFGQHIHIGCSSAENALYLTHALTRYIPQFIAITASSPFSEGIDTGYFSTRTVFFDSLPMCGVIPYFTNWGEFSNYFYKMRKLGIIESMKDVHWDIRPKPEFGTVEIRVCDTPLTLSKSIVITAYLQTLSLYLLSERPMQVSHELYYLHNYNRFQASRYGFQGGFINPYTEKSCSITEDILSTLEKLIPYAKALGTENFIATLEADVVNQFTDAGLLRKIFKKMNSLPEVVAAQCRIWAQNSPGK